MNLLPIVALLQSLLNRAFKTGVAFVMCNRILHSACCQPYMYSVIRSRQSEGVCMAPYHDIKTELIAKVRVQYLKSLKKANVNISAGSSTLSNYLV